MQVVTIVLLFIRFIKIDPSDPKIIRLQQNFMREQKLSFIDHNWSICYLYANCCYPHDYDFFNKKKHQPIVEEEMMFCTVCKAEVNIFFKSYFTNLIYIQKTTYLMHFELSK